MDLERRRRWTEEETLSEDSSDSSTVLGAGMQIQKKRKQETLTNYKNDKDNNLTKITGAQEKKNVSTIWINKRLMGDRQEKIVAVWVDRKLIR